VEIDGLIQYAKYGDKKAFELLVQKYYNELYYTALGIVRSGWDALDICQETFIQAFSSLDTLKESSKFRAWINRILINKCYDFFRKNKNISTTEYIEKEGFIEEGKEDQIDLLRALTSLKDEFRIVLTLRYFQDLSIKEIAAIMGCPEGTIKSRLSNGLEELRRLMKASR
jgi:RNA polymerase sigma-70 factor (ECF subfamily)